LPRQAHAYAGVGKGTVGKAMNDEELYRQAVTLVNRLNGTLEKISAGQGTVGQLLVNPQLYDTLNGTTPGKVSKAAGPSRSTLAASAPPSAGCA